VNCSFKKPTLNPAHLENYRPVAHLQFVTKTLERVVFSQISSFLTQKNLLDNNQSGFKSGHSTETALISVIEVLRLARAASKSSWICSAAFDTVNHQILSILKMKGILGSVLQWFKSYLSDRSFMVLWRGVVSKTQHLVLGCLRAQCSDHFSFPSTVRDITRICDSETWFFLSLLC